MNQGPFYFVLRLLAVLILQTGVYGVHVSIYYYPWYTGIENRGVLRYELRPEQPPVLGSYSSDDRGVISQHLQWSEDYCINNWICSWWGPGHRTDDNITDAIVPQLNESEVTYCLFYESTGRVGMGDISGGNVDSRQQLQLSGLERNFTLIVRLEIRNALRQLFK